MYELALRVELYPGLFRRTIQVTTVPRYCLVNQLAERRIWLKEPGAPDVCLPPGGRLPWQWVRGNGSVRTEGAPWSYLYIAIDRVGTTALHIALFPVRTK